MPVDSAPVSHHAWFKSSYSGGNTTECVEVALTMNDVLIRDSKCPDEHQLVIRPETWSGFLALPRRMPRHGQ
ncbi:DUF397 domain-containing protein [Streptomyces aureoverticillatus]|uniref:DUF397 domain-containing protein n=1 Tax=Streptomyces aureoverticillatus TaxID=66871 RepID=UPI0013DBE9FF|nr:DUF397 domain-containing protein [Streptomyces aureoverticillatus]QIB45582.1 DUF397 domain-containing protein [Streptomyces aureoverticillatus]